MKKDIAITIQNHVQYQSIKIGIDELIKKGVKIDIFVPKAKDEFGVREMFEEIYLFLQTNGYSPKRRPLKKDSYKILLEPYPMDYYFEFNYDYRIKYKYSAISAKPDPVYNITSNIYYDAILCHSTFEENFLNAYTKTYNIGSLKYPYFKKKKTNNKKTILYLPTFGDNNSIEKITPELKKIKDNYRIITKAHHGTNFYNSENNKKEMLKESFDECFSQETELNELFSEADIVISDNSGAIYESIYLEIPVAIISDKISKDLSNIEPLHKKLIRQGVIPYTDNPINVNKIIDEVQKDEIIIKQKKERKKLFKVFGEESIEKFLSVIDLYLNDIINQDYIKMHKYIVSEYEKQISEIEKLNNKLLTNEKTILELKKINYDNKEKISILNKSLKEFYNGKLYKVSTKVYKFLYKIKRGVK